MVNNFDVIVIGAGPAGYVAAVRAAQLGLKTACVDNFCGKTGKPALGGTCLNVGCIPSKALLESSHHVSFLQNQATEHGICVDKTSVDIRQMIARKDAIVEKLNQGIAALFKKNGITAIYGSGVLKKRLADKWQIEVADEQNKQLLVATHVIIATGSRPRDLPQIKIDQKNILDSTGALDLDKVPKRLGIIGAGAIGLELGSVWQRLGSQVTILEAAPCFLPVADHQIAAETLKTLTKYTGLNIKCGVAIQNIQQERQVTVEYQENQQNQKLKIDKLIIAVGRLPNTEGLNVQKVGLVLDQKGFIQTDKTGQTNLPNIWAIGDVTGGPMLAHKASKEGEAVAERIAGKPLLPLELKHVPWVIYTTPEIAWVGKTEQQLKAEKIKYKKGISFFAYNGRALAMGQDTGFVKILVCANTDRILGVHMIGPLVSELIGQAVMAMEFSASGEDIETIIQAHPSLSEAFREAAQAIK